MCAHKYMPYQRESERERERERYLGQKVCQFESTCPSILVFFLGSEYENTLVLTQHPKNGTANTRGEGKRGHARAPVTVTRGVQMVSISFESRKFTVIDAFEHGTVEDCAILEPFSM